MKTFISILMTVFAVQTLAANPECAPSQYAKIGFLRMHCQQGKNFVHIETEQWSTPRGANCANEDYVYAPIALVEVNDADGNVLRKLRLRGGEFEFEWSGSGSGGYFSSRKARLTNLKNCVNPIPGGVSVGN